MTLFAQPRTYTLRALARLLSYPDAGLRDHLADLAGALAAESALPRRRLEELLETVEAFSACDPLQWEAAYVEIFDRGRRTSLNLFEHVHGDSRDRGPAMVDLSKTYESRGFRIASGELPDYLPLVLEFASTLAAREAAAFLGEIAHVVRAVFSALAGHPSRLARGYAVCLAAVLELAGERVERVPLPAEPSLDESYEEPAAFAGCSANGQAAPAAQPLRFVRSMRRNSTASQTDRG